MRGANSRSNWHALSLKAGSLMAMSLGAISVGSGSLAQAQDQQSERIELEEVTVTGTRIQRSGFDTPNPVTVINRELMDSIGITNVGDMMGQLPSNNAQSSPLNTSIGSINDYVTDANIGAQLANLRGLNPFFGTRTLTLVDGHRFVPSTSSGSVDLSLIPSNLVARTEIVTGGASAAYGSDAVAGVVNIVLDKNLEGMKAQVDYGQTLRGDGADFHLGLAGGTSLFDGRGHIVAGGEYADSKAIGACSATRSWCKPYAILDVTDEYRAGNPDYLLVNNLLATPTRNGFISGATMNVPGRGPGTGPFASVTDYNLLPASLIGKEFSADGTTLVDRQPGNLISPANRTMVGGDGLAQDAGTLQRVPVERGAFYTRFGYDLTDNMQAFFEGSYGMRKSGRVQDGLQYALYGGATSGALIKTDNAFLPAGVGAALNAEGYNGFLLAKHPLDGALPAPTSDLESETYRMVAGMEGNFGDSWAWDGYYSYGRTVQDTTLSNARRDTRLSQNDSGIARGRTFATANQWEVSPFDWALDAVVDPADGQVRCRVNSSLADPRIAANPQIADIAAACVPLNLFGVGNIDPAAIDYAWGTITERLDNDQHVVGGNIQGSLFEGWAGPVAGAAGGEYRVETGGTTHGQPENYFAPDFGGDATGKLEVAEAYLETDFTVIKDLPAVRSLDMNAAVRRTKSTASSRGLDKSFVFTTWKLTGVWDIAAPIRIRATRSEDTRAPGFRELFFPGRTTTFNITNVWTGNTDEVDILQNGGGNVDLKQETANSWTLGFVLEPSGWAEGLRLSVDYYEIDLVDGIASVNTTGVMSACQNNPASDLCSRVVGEPDGNGGFSDIVTIRTGAANAQKFTTSGVDFEAMYRFGLYRLFDNAGGDLTFRVLASYLDKLVLESSDTGSGGVQAGVGTNYAGQVGAGGVDDTASFSESPKWQANATISYSNGPVRGTLQTRYVGAAKLYVDLTGPDNGAFDITADNSINSNRIGDYFIFNLSGSYEMDMGGRDVELFAMISNLFDTEPKFAPPLPPGGGYLATNPVYYDTLGRRYQIGVRTSF